MHVRVRNAAVAAGAASKPVAPALISAKARLQLQPGEGQETFSAPTSFAPLRELQSTIGHRAALGVAGADAKLPHLDSIQPSFGHHDLSPVKASIGGEAHEAGKSLGALAFTFGERVGFSGSPDLFTTAHEAAHVIQQRSGVAERQGVGQPGDPLERHADQVAERVVQGVSAEHELDQGIERAGGTRPPGQHHAGIVQFRLDPKAVSESEPGKPKPLGAMDQFGNDPSLVDLEVKLAAVIRQNQERYLGAVSKVTTFWRSFAKNFKGRIGTNESNQLLHGLNTPELASPEFLQQEGPASVSNEHALQQWEGLADSALNNGTVDLHMFFLKNVFESFLDKKSPWRADSQEVLARSFDPELVRKRPAVAPSFKDRGRKPIKDQALEAIVGNKAVDPDSRGKTQTILKPEDRAYTALVNRGTDAWRLDPKAPFNQKTLALGLPLAAGISGSAADFVVMARIAGLKGQELKNFAMAIIYYITLPGHHSFHEVVSVLAADGIVSYRPKPGIGDYSGPLTDDIKKSDSYKALSKEYPGRL